jgi:uncharacterized membrane protein YedE/YeeE
VAAAVRHGFADCRFCVGAVERRLARRSRSASSTSESARPAGKLAWMFVGGLFIGFGTRLGNGYGGHGIFGMSNLERARLTLAFMASGIATTNLIYRVML